MLDYNRKQQSHGKLTKAKLVMSTVSNSVLSHDQKTAKKGKHGRQRMRYVSEAHSQSVFFFFLILFIVSVCLQGSHGCINRAGYSVEGVPLFIPTEVAQLHVKPKKLSFRSMKLPGFCVLWDL